MGHNHEGGCGHGHGGGHHHPAPDKFNLAFGISIIANLGFTMLEVVYAYLAHSTSLLADAAHNLGDVLGLIFAWIAALLLAKSASAKFSYGFKRTTIIASLTNAIILLLSTVLIIREAIEKFIHPAPIVATDVMIVAFIGILINGGTALLFMRGRHDDLNIKGAFLHLAYDALVSLGVVIAAVVIYYTGWEPLDPIVGLIIGAMIIWGTWGLLKDSLKLIMDGVPSHIDLPEVMAYLKSVAGVKNVHDLHIWGLSTKENALTAHLVMPEKRLSDDDRHEIEHHLKEKFKIDHVTIQIEKGDGEHDCAEHAC